MLYPTLAWINARHSRRPELGECLSEIAHRPAAGLRRQAARLSLGPVAGIAGSVAVRVYPARYAGMKPNCL
jgi:hypothetical protein